MLKLGVHVSQKSLVLDSKSKLEISEAIKRDAHGLHLNCAQIFTHGPRIAIENKLDINAIYDIKDVEVSVHSCYSTVGLWKINADNKNSSSSKKKIKEFIDQVKASKAVNADCLVIHIAKRYADEIQYTMDHILKPIAKKEGIVIGLEMVASKSDSNKTYESPEKLDNLITLLGIDENYYGIVVDTAHIHAAGQKIQTYDEMSKWLKNMAFNKKIIMFHLNGCFSERGSGKDKHAIPFTPEDKIWHGIHPLDSGVRAVVEFAYKKKIPLICEINRGTPAQVKEFISIVKEMANYHSL